MSHTSMGYEYVQGSTGRDPDWFRDMPISVKREFGAVQRMISGKARETGALQKYISLAELLKLL